MNTKCSKEMYERACRVIPGGVNSPVRSFRGVGLTPLFIERASGAHIWDIDGNEYIDYVGSWGPMIVGHAHPAVVEAVRRAAANGTSFGAASENEVRLAEAIVSAFESIEKVRLVSSGTEAVMTAVRLARAFTGRDLLVKMDGCYHGHSDSMLVRAGSGAAELGVPASAGIPSDLAQKTITIPYNDAQALEIVFEKYPNQIAGVIVEPIAANMGVVPPKVGYLQSLRRLCTEHRSVLIFDEVITGFRLTYGGVQNLLHLQADLTCLGKIVGGGLPCGAVGGRKEILDLLAPLGPVYQAGTLSGNPLATAASLAVLELLRQPGVYERLEVLSARLEKGLWEAAQAAQIPIQIHRVGSLLSVFFTDKPVNNFQDVQQCSSRLFARFFASMLEQGIYLAPSAFEAWFVSLAHTERDIDRTVQATYNALAVLKTHIF